MLKIWEAGSPKDEWSLRLVDSHMGPQLVIVDPRGLTEVSLATLHADGTLYIEPDCGLFPEVIECAGIQLDENGRIVTTKEMP